MQTTFLPTTNMRVGLRAPGPQRPHSRALTVRCALVERGKRVEPSNVEIGKILGEGSFGQVFEGNLRTGSGDKERVVLKRVKARVQGAEEMHRTELLLNAYAAKVARGHCADFLGYCEVPDGGATTRLTPGLWLMWRYEGRNTLAYYLRRRDTLRALANDMELSESEVVAAVMKQLLTGLVAFHSAGLVHRDVKPLNLILAEEERCFKLIDLGACADLRSGTNYVPDESILDPGYCPPERYVLPTDSPDIAKSALSKMLSPLLWAKHKPDRFDVWSAGMIMLQLTIPAMRSERGVQTFSKAFEKVAYNLQDWRDASNYSQREFAVLDADQGAGWDLLQSLLRPRVVETAEDGGVLFLEQVNGRISAAEALRHRFIRTSEASMRSGTGSSSSTSSSGSAGTKGKAAAAAAASRSKGSSSVNSDSGGAKKKGSSSIKSETGGAKQGMFNQAVSVWQGMTSRLFDLEANIMTTASATQKQADLVRGLRSKSASSEQLRMEEQRLGKLEKELGGLEAEFTKTATAASGFMKALGFGARSGSAGAAQEAPSGKSSKQQQAASDKKAQEKPQEEGGSMWNQMSSGLRSLQFMLLNQATATETQSNSVKYLQQKVAAGKAKPSELAKAEKVLSKMERRLLELSRAQEQALGQTEEADTRGSSSASSAASAASSGVPSLTGFWNSLFGTGVKSKAVPAPEARSDVGAAAPAKSSSSNSSSSSSGGSGSTDTNMVEDALTASKKFSGLAARLAMGMANNIKVEAEQMMKASEDAAKARKQAREDEVAFVAMLKEQAPPFVSSTSTFEMMETACAEDPRFKAVDIKRQRIMLAAHVQRLAEDEKKAKDSAEVMLLSLYRRSGVTSESQWDDISARLAGDVAFQAAADDSERLRVFMDYQAELRKVEEAREERQLRKAIVEAEARTMQEVRKAEEMRLREAVEKADQDFFLLLTEVDNPPVSPQTAWPLLKPQIWKDTRYVAVPEARRRAIFESFLSDLRAVVEAQEAEQQARQGSTVSEAQGPEQTTVALEDYNAMVASLKTQALELEALLKMQADAAAAAAAAATAGGSGEAEGQRDEELELLRKVSPEGITVSRDRDGGLVFSFSSTSSLDSADELELSNARVQREVAKK